MSAATRHALAIGVRRGWTEFVLSVRSPQDQGFYVVCGLGTLAYLWVNRDSRVEGTDLLLPAVALPGIVGAFVVFQAVVGPGFALATEKEDGTLLRHRTLPHGMPAYVTGQLVYHSLCLVPLLLMVLVPSLLLLDVSHQGPTGWLLVAAMTVLGLAATLPLGVLLGAAVPSLQKMGTWGMLPVLVLTAVSGIFVPVQAFWGWVQVVAQAFPTYWVGHGMRAALLPDAAAAAELGGSWRPGTTVAVLLAWAVAGSLACPVVLRRAARRQSGSAVLAARDAAAQWVR